MATFVDDSTSYFGRADPLVVKEVTQRNYNAMENYMHSNKLKINEEKLCLLVLTKEDSVEGGAAAPQRR